MKWAPIAAETTNTAIIGFTAWRHAASASRPVVSAATITPKPPMNTAPRADAISGRRARASQSGQLQSVAIQMPARTASASGFQPCRDRPGVSAFRSAIAAIVGALGRGACGRRRKPQALNRSLTRSLQLLLVGECRSPALRNDSSSSFSSLRWCSVSLIGVSTLTWQYRSPG